MTKKFVLSAIAVLLATPVLSLSQSVLAAEKDSKDVPAVKDTPAAPVHDKDHGDVFGYTRDQWGKYGAVDKRSATGSDETIIGTDSNPIWYNSRAFVQFKDDVPVIPVNPLHPDQPVTPVTPNKPNDTNPHTPAKPGTSGPLTIDFASDLDFGLNDLNANGLKGLKAAPQRIGYDEKTPDKFAFVPDYVQITDRRGTGTDWQLKVTQEGQFNTAADSTKDTKGLEGTVIHLGAPTVKGIAPYASALGAKTLQAADKNGVVAPDGIEIKPDTPVTVMTADGKTGNGGRGSWLRSFGTLKGADEKTGQLTGLSSVAEGTTAYSGPTLDIPQSTVSAIQVNKAYHTVLDWNLSSTPL